MHNPLIFNEEEMSRQFTDPLVSFALHFAVCRVENLQNDQLLLTSVFDRLHDTAESSSRNPEETKNISKSLPYVTSNYLETCQQKWPNMA